jgi:hypothetical protein
MKLNNSHINKYFGIFNVHKKLSNQWPPELFIILRDPPHGHITIQSSHQKSLDSFEPKLAEVING